MVHQTEMKLLKTVQYVFQFLRGMKMIKTPIVKNTPTEDFLKRLRECYIQEEQNNNVVPIFKRALLYGNKIAIRDFTGEYTYLQIYANSHRLSQQLANLTGSGSSSVIAAIYTNDTLYTLILWACWMCGQVVMPINFKCNFNYDGLLSCLKLRKTRLLICSEDYHNLARKLCHDLNIPLILLNHKFVQNEIHDFNQLCRVYLDNNRAVLSGTLANDFYAKHNALLLNVKGDKATIISHRNLSAQLKSGSSIWHINEDDRIYVAYAGNHINGYINSEQFSLGAGATVQLQRNFDGHACWSTLLGLNIPQKDRANIFFSEPHVYKILIDIYDKVFGKNSSMIDFIKNHCQRNYRLMICSFQTLPQYLIKRWFTITGQNIWQNFYLTESGVIMTTYNINAVYTRKTPLPQISIFQSLPYTNYRLIDQSYKIIARLEGTQKMTYPNNSKGNTTIKIGMLAVSGRAVFKKYSNTKQPTIDDNGESFFITGDIFSYDENFCGFRLLGRCCLPIIQSIIKPITCKNNEFYTHLNLHPSIDFVQTNTGQAITYSIKTNRRISLKNLQLFCATMMKQDLYNKAHIFLSSTFLTK